MKRKICIVTGTRAEYGLLSGLMTEIDADSDLELLIIATCMHLSPEFGLTYEEIEKDGYKINKKIEILLSSDTPIGVSKSMGLAHISFCEAYADLKPDIVVLLGDRFETFCAASVATVSHIPIAHIHGGEVTEGAIDDPLRHSVTKMSHLHFTSTEDYRRRVIQMGEEPERVFNVGALGVENIRKLELLSKERLEKEIGFSLEERSMLVTFHPVTSEISQSLLQFNNLLEVIDSIKDIKVIFTTANADEGGRQINRIINKYVSRNNQRSISYSSMGKLKYLSAMKNVTAIIGNSSSGIIEAPSLNTPSVNIGNRQRGRIFAESVISCDAKKDSIKKAIERAFSDKFIELSNNISNPYEKEGTSKEIKEIMVKFDLKNILIKKFYDFSAAESRNRV
ncbi:UDP-N-acetylglucosamine 2-epimerase [Thermodesulfobacteriota bacterium]